MHPQNVKNEMLNTSPRVGALGSVSSGDSNMPSTQKANVYWPTSKTIRVVLLTTLVATPCMVLVDQFFSLIHIPMQLMIALAIKLVMVGMIQFVITEFMAGAFRWKLRNLNRKGATPATPNGVDAGNCTTKNVAQA